MEEKIRKCIGHPSEGDGCGWSGTRSKALGPFDRGNGYEYWLCPECGGKIQSDSEYNFLRGGSAEGEKIRKYAKEILKGSKMSRAGKYLAKKIDEMNGISPSPKQVSRTLVESDDFINTRPKQRGRWMLREEVEKIGGRWMKGLLKEELDLTEEDLDKSYEEAEKKMEARKQVQVNYHPAWYEEGVLA